ncbi:MAG: hypothetical protein KGL19_04195, partial [Bacteroidota bacterium]|nr:hypothetical protein [Bacteroidota bacterium]
MQSNQINIIPSHQINFIKWDDCIAENENGFIYSTSSYLNAMADNWYGLIIDDHKTIMPLPCRKKFGITYLYTPPFMQQLGLIGNEEIDTNAVIKAVQAFASYGNHFFNFKNNFIEHIDTIKKCNNFILDLSSGYENICKNYSTNLQRNIKKTHAEELQYFISHDIDETLNLHQQLQAKNIAHVTADDYNRFEKLCVLLKEKNQCIVRQVKNKSGEILSAAILFSDNRRICNIINATTDEGKKMNANHFLIDNIIQEFAGKNLLFDFEGSN